MTGGYGSVFGTVLGAFMYAMVNAGLLLIGLQGYWVNIFLGVVVLVAVLINRLVIDRFVMSPDRAAARTAGRRRRRGARSQRTPSVLNPRLALAEFDPRRSRQASHRAARRHDEFSIGDGAA